MAATPEPKYRPEATVVRDCFDGRFHLDRSEKRTRGTWGWLDGEVRVTCPRCARTASLQHAVSAEGVVFPSLECPMECGFHENVVLREWDGGERPRKEAA